ncbi:MAG: PEP-CTERM sorting domain-containing protein [Candidatus Competibacteraceae bacterium]
MMTRIRLSIIVLATLGCWRAYPASATPLTFDFDTGTPPLTVGMTIPLTQEVGGVTAQFSSPSGGAFSVQTDSSTHFTLSQFSGNYLYPNQPLQRSALDIQFSQSLTSISLTFATNDSQDSTEFPGNLLLTAYLDSTGTPSIGSATAHGSFASDTFPMGTLTFDAGGAPFNLVELIVPFQTAGTTSFFVDNIIVTPTELPPPEPDPVPEPGSMALVGTGLLALLVRGRRRTK